MVKLLIEEGLFLFIWAPYPMLRARYRSALRRKGGGARPCAAGAQIILEFKKVVLK